MNDRIDEVARQMTGRPAPDGVAFRHRVLSRIERGETPHRVWRTAFVLSPIAIAAAIAMAVVVTRGPVRPARDTTGAPVSAHKAPPPAAVDPGRLDAPMATTETPKTKAASRMTAHGIDRPASVRPAAPPPRLEPDAVASLAVAPLAVDTVSTESIQLERLDSIAPIAVAPLDITDPSRRNP